MRQIPLLSHKFPTCLFIFPFRSACMNFDCIKYYYIKRRRYWKNKKKKSFIKKTLFIANFFWLSFHFLTIYSLTLLIFFIQLLGCRDCFHKYLCLLFCYSLLHSLRFIIFSIAGFWCQKSRNFFCVRKRTRKVSFLP